MSKKQSKTTPTKTTSTKISPTKASPTKTTSQHKILVAFLLNLGFSIFEFFGGAFTKSVAITSDAIHDLGDALSIGVAYFLERYSQKSPNQNYTYGYLRYSVMGGLITTLILIGGSAIVIYESVGRLFHPVAVNYDGMILLAIFGVIVNFAAAYFTHDKSSLNQKSVNLHMLEDVLGWAVVLIGATIMRFSGFAVIDPLLSIAVAIFILVNALQNFRAVLDLFLEKTPQNISLVDLEQHLLELPKVDGVHHIHVWSLDGYRNYATLHIVSENPSSALKSAIRSELGEHGISHATIEFETPGESCEAETCQISCNVESSRHSAHHHSHRHHH